MLHLLYIYISRDLTRFFSKRCPQMCNTPCLQSCSHLVVANFHSILLGAPLNTVNFSSSQFTSVQSVAHSAVARNLWCTALHNVPFQGCTCIARLIFQVDLVSVFQFHTQFWTKELPHPTPPPDDRVTTRTKMTLDDELRRGSMHWQAKIAAAHRRAIRGGGRRAFRVRRTDNSIETV